MTENGRFGRNLEKTKAKQIAQKTPAARVARISQKQITKKWPSVKVIIPKAGETLEINK